MRHVDMMVQKMRNNPKIRDDEDKDYRAVSNAKVEEETEGLQEQIDGLVAELAEHKTANPIDHPDKSVVESKLDDGAASDRAIGDREVDQSKVPDSTNKGLLAILLSWLANRIKAITGNMNWYEDPAVNLVATKNHIDNKENPHETTAVQVPYTPEGDIAAENVQAAITELDTEKLGKTEKAADSELLDGHDSSYFATSANYPADVLLRKSGTDLQVSLDAGVTWKTVTLT